MVPLNSPIHAHNSPLINSQFKSSGVLRAAAVELPTGELDAGVAGAEDDWAMAPCAKSKSAILDKPSMAKRSAMIHRGNG